MQQLAVQQALKEVANSSDALAAETGLGAHGLEFQASRDGCKLEDKGKLIAAGGEIVVGKAQVPDDLGRSEGTRAGIGPNIRQRYGKAVIGDSDDLL